MEEKIYDVFWEGPYPWDKRKKYKPDHVLYAMHGSHHLYGRDVLLYIGRTDTDLETRLNAHEKWVADEYDDMTVRFGSVGPFTNWTDWDTDGRYTKANQDVVRGIEALLINAHQPAYNTMGKNSLACAKGLRVFNSGRCGHLLPEVSYLYYFDQE